MPPQQSPAQNDRPVHKSGAGPTVGIIIIVLLLIFGGLYFWGAKLNETHADAQLPLIPGDPVEQAQ